MLGHQDGAGFGERREPPHLVCELPNVARPSIEHEVLHRLFGEAEVSLVHFLRIFLQVVIRERGDFDAPLAERRDHQADDIEPVEQILAESPWLTRASMSALVAAITRTSTR